MALTLIGRNIRALADHINRYYRVFKGIDKDSVTIRLTAGGAFKVTDDPTGATLFEVTNTGASQTTGSIGGAVTVDTTHVITGTAEQGKWLIKSSGSPGNPSGGGIAAWGTRDALLEVRDMDPALIDSCAILVRYLEDNTGGPPKVRTGIHVNGWTRPDQGESATVIGVQTGAGASLVSYHSQAMRPPGKPDLAYQIGAGLEVAVQDMGPAIYCASGASFPISHVAENGYATLTSAVDAVTTTLPVNLMERIPNPGSAGIYAPGSWPTPLYLKLDNEYVSYTGKSAATGPGNPTGVVRGVAGTTAAAHAISIGVETAHPNHALNVVLARPISKGIIIEPVDGLFNTRPALAVGTRAIGQLADANLTFTLLMNGNFTSVGTATLGGLNMPTGNITVTTGSISTAGLTATGVTTTQGARVISGSAINSPAQITADQNNYNPTGLATTHVLRLNSDAARTISGIAAQPAGTVLSIVNVGSFNIVLAHESGNSTAANRFQLPGGASQTLTLGSSALIWYDGTGATRWRLLGGGPG